MNHLKYLIISLVLLATQNFAKAQSAYVTKSDSMRIDSIFTAKSDSIWKAVEKIKITKTKPVKVEPKSEGKKLGDNKKNDWGGNNDGLPKGNDNVPKGEKGDSKGDNPKKQDNPPVPKIVTNPVAGYSESFQLYKYKGQSNQALILVKQSTSIIKKSPSKYVKSDRNLVLKAYKLLILLNYELDNDEDARAGFNELYKVMGAKTLSSKSLLDKELKLIKL